MVNQITTGKDLKGLYPDKSTLGKLLAQKSLIGTITTLTVPVEGDAPYVRVPYMPIDPEVNFVAEGAEIPNANAKQHEALIQTAKLGIIQELSWEAIRASSPEIPLAVGSENLAATTLLGSAAGTLLVQNMGNGIIGKANQALLNNTDPVGSKGLLKVEGIHDAGALDPNNLDAISDAITAIEAALGTPTHIVIDPMSWGKLRKTKTASEHGTLLLGSAVDATPSTLFGVEVVVTPGMPAGTALVLDSTSILSSYSETKFDVSDQVAFNRDAVVARMTWRFGATVLYPKHLAKVTIPGVGGAAGAGAGTED